MKCLSYKESLDWFASFGVKIVEHRKLDFGELNSGQRKNLTVDIPLEALRLNYFSTRLADWLQNGCDRMFWLTSWETYPPNQAIFFEKIRVACQERRHIIDAPGHLFQSSKYDRSDYESRTSADHEENAVLSGLVLLTLCFNWEGYLISQNHHDYVFLGDKFIKFSSIDRTKFEEALKLMKAFGLQSQD